jgi:BASS family bile acid:Na+ symporter
MKEFIQKYGKVLALLLTMVAGSLLPQLHVFSFLIQYLLMVMLFFAFLDVDFHIHSFQVGMLWVLVANLLIAFFSYWIFSFNPDLALAAFITGIAPTAISSPVVISFIEGKVEYVVGSVLLTNLSIALVVPLVLPFLLGSAARISILQVLQPVMITMFVPLILARLTFLLPSELRLVIRKGKKFSFSVWLINLLFICAKTVDFLHNGGANTSKLLLEIASISLGICVINFSLGALIGGRRFWQEASQALGQKNNSFVIWIALTFINPLVAMGPTFYVLYHNLYNSFQIYLFERRRHDVSKKYIFKSGEEKG